MAALELNIDALKFPDAGEAERQQSRNSLSRVLSPFKSNVKTSNPDSSIPKEYLPNDYEVFLVLRDFLQPGSIITLVDAVNRILEVFPDGGSDLRSVNTVCIELAEQIPYSHISHLKLARLLWLIGRSDKRIDAPTTANIFYQHLLEDLVDNRGDPGDGGADLMRYVNYQAFLANLMEVGVFLPGPGSALYAMRGAFEESHKEESPGIQDAWVLGAAQWILWNGQGLFKLLLWPTDAYVPSIKNNEPVSMWMRDGKLEGTQQVALESWHAWNSRFGEIAGDGAVGEECRRVAGKAAGMMDMLEGGMLF